MMKKHIFTLFAFCLYATLAAQTTAIPDTNFEQALIDLGIDSDGTLNGQVATADVVEVEELDIYMKSISDLTGVQDFINLKYLDATWNPIQIINVSQNLLLESLGLNFAFIETIDISQNINLITLYIRQSNLNSIDVSNNPLLETISLGNHIEDFGGFNVISSIDVSNCPNLRVLDLNSTLAVISLDLSQNANLEELNAGYNNLSNLDLSNNPQLEILNLGNYYGLGESPSNPSLLSLDLSNNPNLVEVRLRKMNLFELDLQNENNGILAPVSARENPNLTCVQVDDEDAATNGEPPYDRFYFDEGVSFSEDCSLGIPKNNFEIGLYPNPTKDFVTINYKGASISKVEVITISGIKIMEVIKRNNIDLTGLSAGIYFLLIETEKGKVIKKVVKL